MRAFFFFAVVAVAVMLAGCRSGPPIQDYVDSPIIGVFGKTYTLEEIQHAIIRAGVARGWSIKPVELGHAVGTLRIRSHVAIVDITYDTKAYNIRYKDSTNLRHNEGRIHGRYNAWVRNLNTALQEMFPDGTRPAGKVKAQ